MSVIRKERKTQPWVQLSVDVSAMDQKLQKLQLNTMIESYEAWKDTRRKMFAKNGDYW